MCLANFIIVARELTWQNLPHTSVVNIQSYISGVDTFCFHERLPCGLHVWNRTRSVNGFHVQSGQSSKSCYYLVKFLSSVNLFLCSVIFYLDKTITGKQLTTISNLSWWGKCSSARTNHNLNISHNKGYSTLQRIAYCVCYHVDMENTSAAGMRMLTFSHCHKWTGTETYPICVDLVLRTSLRSTWLQLLLRYKITSPKLPIKTNIRYSVVYMHSLKYPDQKSTETTAV